MLNFEAFPSREVGVEEEEPIPDPRIDIVEIDGCYGKFSVEPLPRGYAVTLGNPMRRILYSSLEGAAITWVKIEDVLHEYDSVPHVKEEVAEFLMNVKGVRLRSDVDRPGKLRMEVSGQGEVCAGDIITSSDFEVVNPDHHLATLDSDQAKLSVEFNVERGVGYSQIVQNHGLPIGVLPLDAIFSPVRKVNYSFEDLRVGQNTNFERLFIEVWTDGAITPVQAIQRAANILVTNFFLFANLRDEVDGDNESLPVQVSPVEYNVLVESLDLSSRTLNCLRRVEIEKVGELLAMKKEDLLAIRNFGKKSLDEVYNKLREHDLLPPDLDPDLQQNDLDLGKEQESNSEEGLNDTSTLKYEEET